VLTASAPGTYVGFDVATYPGDGVMDALRGTYAFTGFYLPGAPDHAETSWKGRWGRLQTKGWGVVIIYVGRQSDSASLTAAQGTADGKDAIARTKAEGFANGAVVFLDVEYADAMSQAMLDYVSAWLQTVVSDGSYKPGVYCHVHNLPAVQGVAAAAGAPVTFWMCGGGAFSMTMTPSGCGFEGAALWQGWLDSLDPSGTVAFKIDVNLSTSANPSGA
jgi:hypothetical protein